MGVNVVAVATAAAPDDDDDVMPFMGQQENSLEVNVPNNIRTFMQTTRSKCPLTGLQWQS